jgi:hypothetical protein
MTRDQDAADQYRATLALLAAAVDGTDADVTAILGRGWRSSRRAVIAWTLAQWLAGALRRLGHDDPAEAARRVIAESVADEARGAGP